MREEDGRKAMRIETRGGTRDSSRALTHASRAERQQSEIRAAPKGRQNTQGDTRPRRGLRRELGREIFQRTVQRNGNATRNATRTLRMPVRARR